MVQATLGKLLEGRSLLQLRHHPIQILEPACGAGIFLLGAYQYLLDWHLQGYLGQRPQATEELCQTRGGDWQLTIPERQRILLASLYGVDLDPKAVVTTREALVKALLSESPEIEREFWRVPTLQALAHNIKCGNSVIGPDVGDNATAVRAFDWEQEFPTILQTGGFDAVIGNPPYVDAETMALYAPESRRYCTAHYQSATGNWDLFCVFVEKAIALCKPGGFTSLIVPNKLASASYATATRQLLAQQNRLLAIHDYSQVPVFPVAVYPIVYLAQKALPDLGNPVQYLQMSATTEPPTCKIQQALEYKRFTTPHQPWIFGLEYPLIERLQAQFLPLQSVAMVLGAATVAEAYTIQPLIQDVADPAALKVVNSGTIDRYWIGWGQRHCRYLGTTYLHPIISLGQQPHLPQKRQWQATQPKIIVAGMTQILECVADLGGTILAGKSTSIILSSLDLRYLLALLNSKLLTFYYQHCFGGDRLQGGYLRVGPRQLRQLPIKPPEEGDRPLITQILLLVNQRLATPLSPQAKLLDQQLDHLVYQLYQLTAAEIAWVEAGS